MSNNTNPKEKYTLCFKIKCLIVYEKEDINILLLLFTNNMFKKILTIKINETMNNALYK